MFAFDKIDPGYNFYLTKEHQEESGAPLSQLTGLSLLICKMEVICLNDLKGSFHLQVP